MKGLKSIGRRVMSVFLSVVMVVSLALSGVAFAAGNIYNATFTVQYKQTEARKLQTEINNFRTSDDTWYWNSDGVTKTDVLNLSTLTYDYDLEKIAMQRAAELALYYDHIRPNGNDFDTALDGYSYSAPAGECIYAGAGYYAGTASTVMSALKEEDEDFSGQVDRRNMLSEEYARIACACVYVNDTYYWVVLMANSSNSSSSTTANDSTTSVTVPVLEDRLYLSDTKIAGNGIEVGTSQSMPSVPMYVRPTYTAGSYDGISVSVDAPGAWVSSDPNVLSISGSTMTAHAIYSSGGTESVTITATVNGQVYSMTVTVWETIDYIERVESTCTEQGHAAYYYLEETDQYFSDNGLKNEVQYADLLLPLADHNYQETGRIEADCTNNGSITYKCSVCGDSYTETIPALGHNYIETTVSATCEEDGSITYVCSRCQDTYSEIIPATGHNWGDGVITKEPTATEDGEITYTCKNCGATRTAVIEHEEHTHDWSGNYNFYWVVDDNGIPVSATCTFECTACGELETVTCVIMSKVSVPAGCETAGMMDYVATAEDPDRIYTRTNDYYVAIPATGHNYQVTDHVDSTCKDNGYDKYTCQNCGDTYQDELPLSEEHTWDNGVVIKEATATEDGEILFTCEVCGVTMIETIPATGATPDPTTSEDPEPSTTEDPEPSPTSSEEPEPSTTEDPTPSTSEEPSTSPSEDPEPSTTEEPSTSPSEDPEPSGTESPSPSVTDEPSTSPSEHVHSWTPVFAWADNYSSCTVMFYCDDCDEVDGPFNCTLAQAGTIITASYTFEGKTYTDSVNVGPSEPIYTFIWADDYSYCYLSEIDTDGSASMVMCDVGWITIVDPTCKSVGIQGWCAWVGDIVSDPVKYEEIPVTDHTWDDGIIIKEATDTESGEILYTCTVCGAQKAETIPATGTSEPEPTVEHTWVAAFDWTGDISCQVTFTCSDCSETVGPLDCEIESTDDGQVAYIEFEGNIYYDIVDFSGVQFVWSDDYSGCIIYITSKYGAVYAERCDVGWITITEPTCTKSGEQGLCAWYEEYISDFVQYQEIPAAGHKWDGGVIIKEATATEDGEILYTCTVCGATKTETIPATGETPDPSPSEEPSPSPSPSDEPEPSVSEEPSPSPSDHEHAWTPVFIWSTEDGVSCTVTFICDECGEVEGPFECEMAEAGDPGVYVHYIASYEFNGVIYSDSKSVRYGDDIITFTWNDDYTECILTVDNGAEWSAVCDIGWITISEPTCTEPGLRGWYAWYTAWGVYYQSDPAYTETIPANGHQWSVDYIWSEDHTQCTAVFTCDVCKTIEYIVCTVTENGDVYTAECEFDGQTWIATSTGSQIEPSEHDNLLNQLEQLIEDMYALLDEYDLSDEEEAQLRDMIAMAEALLDADASNEDLESMIQNMTSVIDNVKEEHSNSGDENPNDEQPDDGTGGDETSNNDTGQEPESEEPENENKDSENGRNTDAVIINDSDNNSGDSNDGTNVTSDKVSTNGNAGNETSTAAGTNSGTVSGTSGTDSAKTGDNINVFAIIGITAAIGLAACCLIPSRRKKNKI